MLDVILTLNAGSSSIKFALYEVTTGRELELEAHGLLEGMGGNHPHLVVEEEHVGVIFDRGNIGLAGDGTKSVAVLIRRLLTEHRLVAVGHRVVHGGTRYSGPVFVDDTVHRELEALVPLAPLHQPFNLAPMAWIARQYPHVPQIACFDTAYHRGREARFDYLPLPRALHDEGVRPYGFHGLSYEYIARTLPSAAPEIAGKRVVVAHLGSGASMCATRDGKSVDCTLTFTGLGGLPMGTRCGDLDPGVILYLLQQKQMSATEIERLLYKESGLKGLSGVSNDMRELEASTDPNSALAIEVFVQRVCYALGGLATTLGGIDGLVFTAGIGEHSKHVRAEVLRRSAWLGFTLDDARNDGGGPLLTTNDSRARAYVIPTNEELMIALHTLDLAAREAAAL
jgi:acetate kinase